MPVAGPTYAVVNRDAGISLDETFVGQSFLVSGGDRGMYDVTVQLQRTGTTPGSVWIGIFTDDGSGKPDIPLSTTPAILASSVTTSFTSYTFTFSSVPFMEDGGRYHLVVINNGEGWDGSNFIEVGIDSTAPTFADGNAVSRAAGVMEWTTLVSDLVFITQYTDTPPAEPATGDIAIEWPCPCDGQQVEMVEIISELTAIKTVMASYLRPNSEIYVPDVPSAALFQSDWINQGESLPVDDGANLLWWASDDNTFGGPYVPVNSGNIFQAEHEYIHGAAYAVHRPLTTSYPVDVTNAGLVFNTFADPVTQFIDFGTIVVPVASKLLLQFQVHVQLVSVTRTFRMTYFINGTNQYHSEFSTEGVADGYWEVTTVSDHADFAQPGWMHYAILQPGSYDIEVRGTITSGGIAGSTIDLFGGTWPVGAYGLNRNLIPALYLVAV